MHTHTHTQVTHIQQTQHTLFYSWSDSMGNCAFFALEDITKRKVKLLYIL